MKSESASLPGKNLKAVSVLFRQAQDVRELLYAMEQGSIATYREPVASDDRALQDEYRKVSVCWRRAFEMETGI